MRFPSISQNGHREEATLFSYNKVFDYIFLFSDNKLLVNVCAKVGLLYCVEDVCKSSTSMFLNNQYPVL